MRIYGCFGCKSGGVLWINGAGEEEIYKYVGYSSGAVLWINRLEGVKSTDIMDMGLVGGALVQ